MTAIPKSTQLGRYAKSQEIGKIDIKEDDLQAQVNDFLSWSKIVNFHIPDGVWLWLKLNAGRRYA